MLNYFFFFEIDFLFKSMLIVAEQKTKNPKNSNEKIQIESFSMFTQMQNILKCILCKSYNERVIVRLI